MIFGGRLFYHSVQRASRPKVGGPFLLLATISALVEGSATWKLLRADNAPGDWILGIVMKRREEGVVRLRNDVVSYEIVSFLLFWRREPSHARRRRGGGC